MGRGRSSWLAAAAPTAAPTAAPGDDATRSIPSAVIVGRVIIGTAVEVVHVDIVEIPTVELIPTVEIASPPATEAASVDEQARQVPARQVRPQAP